MRRVIRSLIRRLTPSPVQTPSSPSPAQMPRIEVWHNWLSDFNTNPFNIDPANISRQVYLDLAEEVRSRNYPAFMQAVQHAFGVLPEKNFVDELALSTQVVVKSSRLLYLHGYLLYAALFDYLHTHPDIDNPTILETGTARGFSAVCMAKALHDAGHSGKIITIDVLPADKPIYWNCIHDADGKKTRFELLEQWHGLVTKHIIFLQGYTDIVLQQLGLTRIHFAFLDAEHTYDALSHQLAYVAARQQPGDVIVCDDYTPQQFPGVVRAVDELLAGGFYTGQHFQGEAERGYMYCCRT